MITLMNLVTFTGGILFGCFVWLKTDDLDCFFYLAIFLIQKG